MIEAAASGGGGAAVWRGEKVKKSVRFLISIIMCMILVLTSMTAVFSVSGNSPEGQRDGDLKGAVTEDMEDNESGTDPSAGDDEAEEDPSDAGKESKDAKETAAEEGEEGGENISEKKPAEKLKGLKSLASPSLKAVPSYVTSEVEMSQDETKEGNFTIGKDGVVLGPKNGTATISSGTVTNNAINNRQGGYSSTNGSAFVCQKELAFENVKIISGKNTLVLNIWANTAVNATDLTLTGSANSSNETPFLMIGGYPEGAAGTLNFSGSSMISGAKGSIVGGNNNSAINVNDGTLSIIGSDIKMGSGATIVVKSGAALVIDGSTLTDAKITVEQGGTLEIKNGSSLTGTWISNSGTTKIAGTESSKIELNSCVFKNLQNSLLEISHAKLHGSTRNSGIREDGVYETMIHGVDADIILADTEIYNNTNEQGNPSPDKLPGPSIISLKGGSVKIENVDAHDNTVKTNGGVMHASGTKVTVEKSRFKNNKADTDGRENPGTRKGGDLPHGYNYGPWYGKGGALFLEECPEVTISESCSFEENTATEGGAVFVRSNGVKSATSILDSEFKNNYGARAAGALMIRGKNAETSVLGTVFEGNKAQHYGGAMMVVETDEIGTTISASEKRQTIFKNNTVSNAKDFGGGGLHINNAHVKMEDTAVYDNSAVDAGGGISTCAVGTAQVRVFHGAAIYNNKVTQDRGKFGDVKVKEKYQDVFLLTRDHIDHNNENPIEDTFGNHAYEIYESMFNGGLHRWDSAEVRGTPNDRKVRVWSLVAQSDPTSKAGITENAKVIFEGNSVETKNNDENKVVSGGAIGCNGYLEIGRAKKTEIKIVKAWDDNKDKDGIRPDIGTFVKGLKLYRKDSDGNRTEIALPEVTVREGSEQPAASGTDHSTGIKVDIFTAGTYTASGNISSDPGSHVMAGYDDKTGLDKWVAVVSGLQVPGGGEAYVIGENKFFGYVETDEVQKEASGFYELTNSHEDALTSVSGTKIWNDAGHEAARPESIKVMLLVNGEKYKETETTAAQGWNWSFDGLPRYSGKGEDKTEIEYTFAESKIKDYVSHLDEDKYEITNSYDTDHISLAVFKHWEDENDQDGKRPKQVVVTLLRKLEGESGFTPVEGRTVILSESGKWKGAFENLPVKVDGKKAEYSVQEEKVDGYSSKLDESLKDDDKLTLINTHRPEKVDIPVTKAWVDGNDQDGIRPEYIEVLLYAKKSEKADAELIRTAKIGEGENWKWTFTGLPKYHNKFEIEYTVKESVPAGYESKIKKSGGTYEITNTHKPEGMTLEGEKTWNDRNDHDGIRPESIKVRLLADGKPVPGGVKTVTAGDGWKWKFEHLPVFRSGVRIEYSIEEDPVEGYTPEYVADGFSIVNTHEPVTDVRGTKVWNDGDDREGKRPDSITVTLLADGEPVPDMVRTVTAEDNWTWSFKDLPEFKDHEQIIYTVAENRVHGYSASYSDKDIVNTYTSGKTSLTVTKHWADEHNRDGKRPASITVRLLADGEPTEKTLVLSADNKWEGSFTELDEKKDGKDIDYTVEEVDVPENYESNVKEIENVGFEIINTHKPETIDVSGKKVWKDNSDQDGKRPVSITVRLLADGEPVPGGVKTVTAEDGWKWSFEGLPKYAEGEVGREITYTFTEDAVHGYSTSYDGMDINNSRTPGRTSVTVSKSWDDGNDADKIRPEKITVKLMADGKDTGKRLVLSKENNWMGSFTELDEKSKGEKITYTVREVSVKGYTSTVKGDQKTGYVITNKHSQDKKGASGKTGGRGNTGDTNNMAAWILIMSAAAAALLGLLIKRRPER